MRAKVVEKAAEASTSATTAVADSDPRPWKLDVTGGALAIACTINGLFFALALADVSADLFAVSMPPQLGMPWLAAYVAFRGTMPIFMPLILFGIFPLMCLGLISSFFGFLQAVFQTWRGTRVRNLVDVVEFFTFCGIIYFVPAYFLPSETAVYNACVTLSADCMTAYNYMFSVHLTILLFVLIMFSLPIIKYNCGNRGPSDAAEAVLQTPKTGSELL